MCFQNKYDSIHYPFFISKVNIIIIILFIIIDKYNLARYCVSKYSDLPNKIPNNCLIDY